MEARFARVLVVFLAPALMGATYPAHTYQTKAKNFVVTARTPEIARQVGEMAEVYRQQLAMEWLGHELPRWSAPCPISVHDDRLGAGGATTFSFFPNAQGSAEVCNWDMKIQGSLERILDSVLPHEVSHTIFACHFRRPLPRWADEGAATLAEHESERSRQDQTLKQVIRTQRRIPLKNLLSIKDYPPNPQDVLTLYAEGYSLAWLLVQEGGRARYLKFLADAHQNGWEKAIRTQYGYSGIEDLEKRWYDWVMAGSPEIDLPKGQLYADDSRNRRPAAPAQLIVRGQKPNETEDPFLADSSSDEEEPRRAAPAKGLLAAPEPRRLPMNRKTAHPVAATRREAGSIAESTDEERSVEDDVPPRPRQTKPVEKPDAKSSRTNEQEIQVAGSRNPVTQRQVTEWSEFPQDPRPSPFALPGRNRSGARP
jgi:hypothetical protein